MTDITAPFRFAALVALALGCAASCRSPAPAPPAVDWELRGFDVRGADRDKVADVLSSLLKDKGRVRTGPDGRLIVLAAPSTQRQIKDEILDPMARRPPGPRPSEGPPSFSITYWMLLVRPTHGTAAPSTPALPEISQVIPEIQKTSGPADLVLLDRIRLMSGDRLAETTGRIFGVKQMASLAAGRVVSDIHIEAHLDGNSMPARLISTRLSLQPGQVAVVGEIGLPGLPRGLPKQMRPPEAGDSLYLIVKASVDDAIAQK